MILKKYPLIILMLIYSNQIFSDECEVIQMKSISPFFIHNLNGQKNLSGMEFNFWNSHHPAKQCKPIYGYGARVSGKLDGVLFSPYIQGSLLDMIEIIGLSIGPEIGFHQNTIDVGFSTKAWLLFFGIEYKMMIEEKSSLGIYYYLPIHQIMFQ